MKVIFDTYGNPIGSDFAENEYRLLEKDSSILDRLSEIKTKEFEIYMNSFNKFQEEMTKRFTSLCRQSYFNYGNK